jgi:DNA polymerase-3 subunit beta
MEIVALKNNLLGGLSALEKAIGSNTNLPILKNVLIETENNKITFTGTNLELAVKSFVSGKIIENGKVTVPFNLLEAIVRNIPSERVSLKKKEKNLLVSTDNYEALVQGQDAKEFPIIPRIHSSDKSLKIPVETFRNALGNVIIATQYSEIRPEISGVFLHYHYLEGVLTFVATDSFRLAEQKISGESIKSTFETFALIIPLPTAEEILRAIANEEGEAEIFIDPNQILVRTPTREVISRLVDGHFPDYQSIIPKETAINISLEREELMNAIKVVSSFSGRGNDITLKIGDNKKFLEIYSATSALGENRYRVPVKSKSGKFSIVFNWRFLLDGLRIYKTSEVILGLNVSEREREKPAVIRSSDSPNLLYILMPIKA